MTVVTPNMNKVEGSNKAAQINAKIKAAWNKLSDDDIKLYSTNRQQFLARLKEKQNVSPEDAEKRLREIEGAAGGAAKSGSAKVA